MKKSIISIVICMLFGASLWAQNETATTDLKAYLDGQSDGFLLKTSSSTFIINVGARFYQCKQIAELATRGKAFNQEMFQNALAQMDTIDFAAQYVKEFKAWGETFIAANATFKKLDWGDHSTFMKTCRKYELIKSMFQVDGVIIFIINGLNLVSIHNSQTIARSFSERSSGLAGAPANTVSIGSERGYLVKVVPNEYLIDWKE